MRSISRITGVSISTVSKLLLDAGEAGAAYHDEHVRGLKCKRIQCDEIWSFTYAKSKNVDAAKKTQRCSQVMFGLGPASMPSSPMCLCKTWPTVSQAGYR